MNLSSAFQPTNPNPITPRDEASHSGCPSTRYEKQNKKKRANCAGDSVCILLCLRAHGWTRNLPRENHVSNKSEDLFTESFRFVLPGYNVRPLEMIGPIGIEQLKKLPKLLTQHNNNVEYFLQKFHSDDRFILLKETGVSPWFDFH